MSELESIRPRTLARRDFLKLAGAATAAVVTPGLAVAATEQPAPPGIPDEFPRQSADVVREVVGVAHGQFDRLRELVDARPSLAKANWDWGYGDWESALGAASHVGRRDIAEYLIGKGARPNVFSAAMLGQLDVVKAFVTADPGVVLIPGPHGIPLVAHARAGGDEAKPVLEYLEGLGKAPEAAAGPDDAERAAAAGRYVFGSGDTQSFEVTDKNGALSIARTGQPGRRLTRLQPGVYHPAGAPHVRVEFSAGATPAPALTLRDGPAIVVTARRAADS